MKRIKFIYLYCVLGIIGIPGAFAQSEDKLLTILSGELNEHYRELQGRNSPPII